MAIEKMETRVGPVFIIRPDDDTTSAYLRGKVGSLASVTRPAEFLRAAMAGNRFGLATDGATLSLEDDAETVNLTLRLDAAYLSDEAGTTRAVDRFASVLRVWQERLSTYIPEAAEEVK